MSRSEHELPESTRYAEAVPAVSRALDVMDYLRTISEAPTLSTMSRALQISPSSLSAILRTLNSRGYVRRDDVSGRYRLGSALGNLAADSASHLVMHDAAEAVVMLARASIAVSGQDGHSDHHSEALVALGLAGRHLSSLLLGEQGSSVPERNDPEPVWRSEGSGPLTPTELDQFLAADWVATLSCLKENGYPYSVPVWYHWEDACFWILSRSRAEWARYIEQNPHVSLAISENRPPFRRVLVEGKAEMVSDPDNTEHILQLTTRMAYRYLGSAAAAYLESATLQARRAFAITPEKIVTWHGLASHPRYHLAQSSSADDTGAA